MGQGPNRRRHHISADWPHYGRSGYPSNRRSPGQQLSTGGSLYDSFSIRPKHIKVITLVEGQAAVAHFYAEGSMKPKGFPAVTHYLTRVTQVFVKEEGKWKICSSHWSPVAGGLGTTLTAVEE